MLMNQCMMEASRIRRGGESSKMRSSSLASLRSHARSIGSLPTLQSPAAAASRRDSIPVDASPKRRQQPDAPSPAATPLRSSPASPTWHSCKPSPSTPSSSLGVLKAAAEEVAGGTRCSTPSTRRSFGWSSRSSSTTTVSALSHGSRNSTRPNTPETLLESPEASPTSLRGAGRGVPRRSSSTSSLASRGVAAARAARAARAKRASEEPKSPPDSPEVAEQPGSACRRASSKLSCLAGASLIPTCGADVAEVCRVAKTMLVPAHEFQQPYSLFQEFAQLQAGGDRLIRDGRLSEQQFGQLVRRHVLCGEEAEVEDIIQSAFKVADADKDGHISFQEFASWMITQTWDENLHIDESERELRRLAREFDLSFVEVDRYKRMFDELDTDGSGAIENCEFEQMLYRCGNIPADIGLSAQRRHSLWLAADPRLQGYMGFEGFLKFNLKYFAQGATGFNDIYDLGGRKTRMF